MIPNDFIQTLLGRVDIVEVVDRYVPLRKAGANYVACCPFHSEKTPSFSVSPAKQFYHCFGCGAHGTAIGFLMEHAGKTFPDAVDELARDAGLEVPRIERAGDKERREEAQDLNEMLAGSGEVLPRATERCAAGDRLSEKARLDRGDRGPVRRRLRAGCLAEPGGGVSEVRRSGARRGRPRDQR